MENFELENKKLKKLLELQQYEEKERDAKHKFELKLLKDTHKKELSDLRRSNNILIGENSDLLDRLNVLKAACIKPTQVTVEIQTDFFKNSETSKQTHINAISNTTQVTPEALIDLFDELSGNNLSLHEEILIATRKNESPTQVNVAMHETLNQNEELSKNINSHVIEDDTKQNAILSPEIVTAHVTHTHSEEILSKDTCPNETQTLINETNSTKNTVKQIRVQIVSDSNGRDMAAVLKGILPDRFHISSACFPNAKLNTIFEQTKEACSKLTSDDFLIVVGGTNDALNSKELPNLARLRQLSYKCHVIVLETRNIHATNCDIVDLQRVNNYIDCMNAKLHSHKGANIYTTISTADLPDHAMRRDGFHFTSKGKEQLAYRMKHSIYDILDTPIRPQPIPVLMTARIDNIPVSVTTNVPHSLPVSAPSNDHPFPCRPNHPRQR